MDSDPGDELTLKLRRPGPLHVALAQDRFELEQRRDLGIGGQLFERGSIRRAVFGRGPS